LVNVVFISIRAQDSGFRRFVNLCYDPNHIPNLRTQPIK
jgi:hypothetical protein